MPAITESRGLEPKSYSPFQRTAFKGIGSKFFYGIGSRAAGTIRGADQRDIKPKVLQMVADGSPGGGTTHVLQILRGLHRTFSLGLVTQKGSYLSNKAQRLGVPCFEADFFRGRLDPRVSLRLRGIVRKFEPQVVHAHGGRAAFFCALAKIQVPFVYTVHGYHFLYKGAVACWLALFAERLTSRRAERVVFVSEHDARVAQAHNVLSDLEHGIVVHNGIRLADFPASSPKLPKHIGFVGRLEYPKDPLLFLDVLENLPGHTATIIGGGTLEDEVSDEIVRRSLLGVRVLGLLPHQDVLKIISSLSVLVITSRWEGLPVLPLEAMWAEVPVVATNVGGLGEIIEDGESGLLIEGRSPDDIARAVGRLTEDTALRERIVENGRNRVRSMFSEERMLNEIQKVYLQVAGL